MSSTCLLLANLIFTGYFDQSEIDKIMEESLKMKRFEHRHVMGLVGVCLDAGPAPYIIMPYMANGSLHSYLKKERKSLVLREDANADTVSYSAISFNLKIENELTLLLLPNFQSVMGTQFDS